MIRLPRLIALAALACFLLVAEGSARASDPAEAAPTPPPSDTSHFSAPIHPSYPDAAAEASPDDALPDTAFVIPTDLPPAPETAPAAPARVEPTPPDAHPPAPAASPTETPHAGPAAPAATPHAASDHPATPAAGASATTTPAPTHGHGPAARSGDDYSSTLAPDERASLLRLGQNKLAAGDTDSSLQAARRVLASHATADEEQAALLLLARTHRARSELTRAAAVYERLLKDYPSNPSAPVAFLEVGRVHRALGAEKLALARFYSVLHSTLKMPDDGPEDYRRLARTAQFEIAETHFLCGRYDDAERFFSRLSLLELAPEDRDRAEFKALQSSYLAGQLVRTANLLPTWIAQHPDAADSPEARQLLAVVLRRLGRTQEAFNVTVDLLRSEHARQSTNPKRWLYWQRRTGNQIGNELYQNGDYLSALQIYQNLGALDPDPRWALPASYQAALCLERLGQTEQAAALYQKVIDGGRETSAPEIREVAEMAAWRLGQTQWRRGNEERIRIFFQSDPESPAPAATTPSLTAELSPPPAAATAPAPAPTTATASASAGPLAQASPAAGSPAHPLP